MLHDSVIDRINEHQDRRPLRRRRLVFVLSLCSSFVLCPTPAPANPHHAAATSTRSTEQPAPKELSATHDSQSSAPRGDLPQSADREPLVERRAGPSSAWFWTTASLATSLLAASAVTGALAWRKSSRFNDPATPAGALESLEDDGMALRTAATLTFGAGMAALTSAVLFFFFTDFVPAGAATVTVAPAASGALLSLERAF